MNNGCTHFLMVYIVRQYSAAGHISARTQLFTAPKCKDHVAEQFIRKRTRWKSAVFYFDFLDISPLNHAYFDISLSKSSYFIFNSESHNLIKSALRVKFSQLIRNKKNILSITIFTRFMFLLSIFTPYSLFSLLFPSLFHLFSLIYLHSLSVPLLSLCLISIYLLWSYFLSSLLFTFLECEHNGNVDENDGNDLSVWR